MADRIERPSYVEQAERVALPLSMAIFGPSKSGKTLTALKVMRGILPAGEPFVVIDTEGGRSREYSSVPGQKPTEVEPFDIAKMSKNFAAERFVKLFGELVAAGYRGIVVDGLTPLWNGPGGVQAVVDANDHGYGSGWKVGNPAHATIVRTITECPVHLICTMRSKTAYADEGGNKFPKKVGLKPIQRDEIEYEFRLLGEMDMDNNLRITGREGFQNRVVEKPGIELAQELLEYLGHVEPQQPPTAPPELPPEAPPSPPPAAPASGPPGATPSVEMMSPEGEVATVPGAGRATMEAAGWVMKPELPPDPPTYDDPPPSPPLPPAAEDAPAETDQLAEIVKLSAKLAEVKPGAGDAAVWMAWAEDKARESYGQEFNTLTRDNAAALIERLNRYILAQTSQQ